MIARIVFGTLLEKTKCLTIIFIYVAQYFVDLYICMTYHLPKKCRFFFLKKTYNNNYKNNFIEKIYIFRTCKIIYNI